jgi:hypothetical protein
VGSGEGRCAVGEEVERKDFTREDRTRDRHKIRRSLDVFASMLRESRFDFERPLTGMEIELNLVDGDADPAMRNAEVLASLADPTRTSRPSSASSTSRSTWRRAGSPATAAPSWNKSCAPASTTPRSTPAPRARTWR